MSQSRSVFLVQMLDKLGAPLLGAIAAAGAAESGEAAGGRAEAERMAELLARSVKTGIALAERLDLRQGGGDEDAMRLALAGLAAALISDYYRQNGIAPDENETRRLIDALQAVLSFADNFTAAAENTARLAALTPGVFPADENQIAIQYVHALSPVVNEIAAFPFGHQERRLAQETARRLSAQAAALGARLLSAETDAAEKARSELVLMKALAALYIECHRAEKVRLLSLSESERQQLAAQSGGALPMDRVWQDFELRASMLEALGENVLPDGAEERPAVMAAPLPAARPPAPPEPPPAPPEPPAESGGYNPMAFFKPGGKKADEDEGGA